MYNCIMYLYKEYSILFPKLTMSTTVSCTTCFMYNCIKYNCVVYNYLGSVGDGNGREWKGGEEGGTE